MSIAFNIYNADQPRNILPCVRSPIWCIILLLFELSDIAGFMSNPEVSSMVFTILPTSPKYSLRCVAQEENRHKVFLKMCGSGGSQACNY